MELFGNWVAMYSWHASGGHSQRGSIHHSFRSTQFGPMYHGRSVLTIVLVISWVGVKSPITRGMPSHPVVIKPVPATCVTTCGTSLYFSSGCDAEEVHFDDKAVVIDLQFDHTSVQISGPCNCAEHV